MVEKKSDLSFFWYQIYIENQFFSQCSRPQNR